MTSLFMTSVIITCVIKRSGPMMNTLTQKCRYGDFRYECHYGECRFVQSRYNECRQGECHYDECHYDWRFASGSLRVSLQLVLL